jgi:hypothetical protein
MDEPVKVAPGVWRHEWSSCWILSGKMDALIASGLVPAEWFPNDVDRNERGQVIRTKHVTHEEREVRVRRTANNGCEVRFYRTKEEEAVLDKAEQQKAQLQREEKERTDNLRNWKDPKDWLGRDVESVTEWLDRAFPRCDEDEVLSVENMNGTRFELDGPDVNQLRKEFQAVIRKIRILPVTVTRWDEEIGTPNARLAASSAQTDAKFQRFMQRVVPR